MHFKSSCQKQVLMAQFFQLQVSALEGHLCKTETQIDSLLRKLNAANDTIRSLQQELKDRDMALNQRIIDKQKVKQKYTYKMQHEQDKMSRELELKLKAQRDHLQVPIFQLRRIWLFCLYFRARQPIFVLIYCPSLASPTSRALRERKIKR